MKIKYIVSLQVVFLIGAVIAGLLLKANLADGPRMAHRLFGTLAGLSSLISLGVLAAHKAQKSHIALAVVAFALSLVAGAAGKSLKTASDYSANFNAMRISGALALVVSVILLSTLRKSAQSSGADTSSDK